MCVTSDEHNRLEYSGTPLQGHLSHSKYIPLLQTQTPEMKTCVVVFCTIDVLTREDPLYIAHEPLCHVVCRVPMMWSAAMHNIQLFLCKYVFLERRRGTLPLIRFKYTTSDTATIKTHTLFPGVYTQVAVRHPGLRFLLLQRHIRSPDVLPSDIRRGYIHVRHAL